MYVRNILELQTIRERDVAKIHDFYEKPLFNVESLLTLKKLNELDAAARFTFDKLEVIKNKLALIDGNWRDWTFKEFQEPIQEVQLHAFSDASGYGVNTAVYAL